MMLYVSYRFLKRLSFKAQKFKSLSRVPKGPGNSFKELK